MDFKVIPATDPGLIEKAFQVRKEVFVIEQKVSTEEEFDGFEDESYHFVAIDTVGKPVGAARWRWTKKGIKLERFAVKESMRGKGLGSALVRATLDDIRKNAEQGTYLYMHAQLDAILLYEKFGFEKRGELFEECGIMHYLMEKFL